MSDSISTMALFKNLSYVVAFVASLEWIGLNPQAMAVFSILMLVDIATGVTRAAIVSGGRSVRSAVLKKGVVAKLLILTAIFSVALAGKGIGFDMAVLAQAAVNVLILGELYSILGNVHSVRTGNKKIEFDAVAFILSRVRELLEKAMK